jgi:tetratricopeptide (TPR) repeat protein
MLKLAIARKKCIQYQEKMVGIVEASLRPMLVLGLGVALSLGQTSPRKQETIAAHAEKAEKALKSGDAATAARELNSLLALDPQNVDARGNLGVARFIQGDWASAAEQFQAVLKVQPQLWRAQALLGMCERRLGHTAEARRWLAQSVPHLHGGSLSVQAGLDLVEILYQSNDIDQATGVVRALEAANPANADVLYTGYRLHTDLANHFRDALAQVAPDGARMRELVAQHLVNEGNLPEALAQYRMALAIDPKLPGVHYELGETILQDSSSDLARHQAEKELREALAENPADANAEYRLGQIDALQLDVDGALQHYARALQLEPGNIHAQIGMADVMMKRNEVQEALEHLLAASRLDPSNAIVHYRLGGIYRSLGRTSQAHLEFETFKRLQESKKQIEHVYGQMHLVIPPEELVPPDASKN